MLKSWFLPCTTKRIDMPHHVWSRNVTNPFHILLPPAFRSSCQSCKHRQWQRIMSGSLQTCQSSYPGLNSWSLRLAAIFQSIKGRQRAKPSQVKVRKNLKSHPRKSIIHWSHRNFKSFIILNSSYHPRIHLSTELACWTALVQPWS